jgi:hypothetical protein
MFRTPEILQLARAMHHDDSDKIKPTPLSLRECRPTSRGKPKKFIEIKGTFCCNGVIRGIKSRSHEFAVSGHVARVSTHDVEQRSLLRAGSNVTGRTRNFLDWARKAQKRARSSKLKSFSNSYQTKGSVTWIKHLDEGLLASATFLNQCRIRALARERRLR